MLFIPNKKKFLKCHKGNISNVESKSFFLNWGLIGLITLEKGKLNNLQLNQINFFLKKKLLKNYKIWLKIYPNISKTKKPLETRMGKGKGKIDHWYCKLRKKFCFIEIGNNKSHLDFIELENIKKILYSLKKKIPFKTKIIKYVN